MSSNTCRWYAIKRAAKKKYDCDLCVTAIGPANPQYVQLMRRKHPKARCYNKRICFDCAKKFGLWDSPVKKFWVDLPFA